MTLHVRKRLFSETDTIQLWMLFGAFCLSISGNSTEMVDFSSDFAKKDTVLTQAEMQIRNTTRWGTNIRRPFLHVRYRASQADDRRMKTWLTGSVGGAYTSDLDAMEVNFLSERCLCVQGANNFVLFKAS